MSLNLHVKNLSKLRQNISVGLVSEVNPQESRFEVQQGIVYLSIIQCLTLSNLSDCSTLFIYGPLDVPIQVTCLSISLALSLDLTSLVIVVSVSIDG